MGIVMLVWGILFALTGIFKTVPEESITFGIVVGSILIAIGAICLDDDF